MIDFLHLWWLKYQIRLCAHRKEELAKIVQRESKMIDYEEHILNVRLRELRSRQLQRGLPAVR